MGLIETALAATETAAAPNQDPDSTPQWVLIGVLLISAVIALTSIAAQRVIAKKRAAYDYMVRVKGDPNYLSEQNTFLELVQSKNLDSVVTAATTYELAQKQAVRNYLNYFELLCVSIEHNIIDEDVCKGYMKSTLVKRYHDSQSLIAKVRTHEPSGGSDTTFEYFEKVAKRWQKHTGPRYGPGFFNGIRRLWRELMTL